MLPSTRLECEVIIDSKLNGIIDLYLQVADIPWIQISNRFFLHIKLYSIGKRRKSSESKPVCRRSGNLKVRPLNNLTKMIF